MDEPVFRLAALSDMDLLVSTRIEVLRAANGLPESADMTHIERESRLYYERSLCSGEHVAVLVFCGEEFAGCGGISFFQVMPTCHNPTGRKAYIMNMYTRPQYRRRGIAYRTLDILTHAALEKEVDAISLEATAAGRPLYAKYGFTQMGSEMEWRKGGIY